MLLRRDTLDDLLMAQRSSVVHDSRSLVEDDDDDDDADGAAIMHICAAVLGCGYTIWVREGNTSMISLLPFGIDTTSCSVLRNLARQCRYAWGKTMLDYALA